MRDIKRYAQMPMEVMGVVRGFLQSFTQPTLTMVRNLVAIETEHINLGHPDFVEVTKNVSASDDDSEAGAKAREQEDRLKNSKEQGFFSNFFNNKDSQKRATGGPMRVDQHLTVGAEGISVREQRGLDLLKGMIEVYFSIVRRKLCDQVPKTIMAMLVNRLKDQLYGILVAKLYNASNIDTLLAETDEVVNRRRQLKEIHAMLTKAIEALDEVQGIGTKVVCE